jgi:flagellin
MVINTNVQAQAASRELQTSQAMLSRSLARLSSGSKIINPADDAAGLAVSMQLDAQVKRIEAARNNVSNAVSFTQTQDGYLKKIAKALDRMSELAILAQDVTKSDSDRSLYDQEFTQLKEYITSTASKEFNGVSLFSSSSLSVTTDSEGNTFSMSGINLSASVYSNVTSASISVSSVSGASSALAQVKSAIAQLASDRAKIGAYQARLNYTAEQLSVSKENLMAASSRIQDVDIAEESTQYARFNILVQSGTAMLAQANQLPQSVLRLLQ